MAAITQHRLTDCGQPGNPAPRNLPYDDPFHYRQQGLCFNFITSVLRLEMQLKCPLKMGKTKTLIACDWIASFTSKWKKFGILKMQNSLKLTLESFDILNKNRFDTLLIFKTKVFLDSYF